MNGSRKEEKKTKIISIQWHGACRVEVKSSLKKKIAFPFFLKLQILSGHLRPSGTVSQTFEPENLKDVLPKLVDTLRLKKSNSQIGYLTVYSWAPCSNFKFSLRFFPQ